MNFFWRRGHPRAPKASSMVGTRVLCWVVGDGAGAREVDWALSELVHVSDLVLPPCGLLADKTSLCPCTEEVT